MDKDSQLSLKKIVHELTQPLTTIKAYGFVASSQLDSGVYDPKVVANTVKKMVEAADFVSELLKRFSTIELAANLQFSVVDLAELIRKPCGLIEPNLRHFGIDLQIAEMPDCQVNVDAVHIQAAVINLFRNSIESRRNESDATPVIKVEASVNDEWVEVIVGDNGMGIPEEKREDLFQNGNSEGSGRGMGLSMCKEIVELHGGEIWHKDNSPAGAKFHFTLPLAKRGNQTFVQAKGDLIRNLKGDVRV